MGYGMPQQDASCKIDGDKVVQYMRCIEAQEPGKEVNKKETAPSCYTAEVCKFCERSTGAESTRQCVKQKSRSKKVDWNKTKSCKYCIWLQNS